MKLDLRCEKCDMPLEPKQMSDGKYVYSCPTCDCSVTSRFFNIEMAAGKYYGKPRPKHNLGEEDQNGDSETQQSQKHEIYEKIIEERRKRRK